MKTLFLKGFFAVLAMLLHLSVHAEDIDLFVGATPSAANAPNVLIILDNTANWNSAFVNEKAALVSVFNGLPLDKFRVGLMMFTETGGANSGEDGAYVRAAIRPMNAVNRAKYAALINGLHVNDDKSNGGKIGKSMEEAYLYLTGGNVHAGNKKAKADFAGNSYWSGFGDNALTSKDAGRYTSPLLESCTKTYIIYISNGAAQDNSSDTTQASGALVAAGGSTAQIPLNPSGSQDNVADEWARFMKTSAIGATVYTIDINKVTTGQGPGWTALLKSMAAQSSGKYFDVSSGNAGNEISNALNNVFSEIQSVNSVFASVSLPVSVNTQGTYLNQVYVGMFRPDQFGAPRWNGNLKQYKLGLVNDVLRLQDADNASAINNQTGFIAECARSYWTPTAVDTEWTYRPQGDCLTVANSRISNYPDGNVVDKGGQAYKLRGSSTRTIFTCAGGTSCTSSSHMVPFTTANVTPAMLGVATTAERDQLVRWATGPDVDDNDPTDGITTAQRRLSLHGDVVHSRPVAINYGTDGAPNVVVFYGGNDGMLRAVNGNRANAIGGIPAGGELWSFLPVEFQTSIKRLRDNAPVISFPTMVPPAGVTPLPKPYGVDGPITAFKGTIGGVSKSFIYSTMRRGGRAIYGFDVTNGATSPSSPTLKWKIGCPSMTTDVGCSAGASGMGQTWSSPKSMTASGYGGAPLLIMGGGYDTCDDFDGGTGAANHNCTAASKGHYVYVINADTGAIVKTFDTGGIRGVIADVTLVRDGAGDVIYGYTADLGGNVYRMNFSGGVAGDASGWTITKIASLGCDTTASCTANRKFMFAPSVVAVDGNYVVMLGSGDREKPLTYYRATTALTNHFFMFTDKPTNASWPGTTDCGSAVICKASLFGITTSATPTAADLASRKGWYLGLTSSEQVVTSAITIFGIVTFSTHQPAVPTSGSCTSNLGTARVYNMSFTDAAPAKGTSRFDHLSGDGLPPSPVAGRVRLEDGTISPFCIGCTKESPLEGTTPPELGSVIQPKGRLYWYIQK